MPPEKVVIDNGCHHVVAKPANAWKREISRRSLAPWALRLKLSLDLSAGAIEKVSDNADEHQDDDDGGDYSEGNHSDTLKGFSEERKHSTRIQHREPRDKRRDRHRLVGKARLETAIAVLRVAPGLAEDCQI